MTVKKKIETEEQLQKEIDKRLEITFEQDRSTGLYTVFVNGDELESKFSTMQDRDKAIARIRAGLDWK